MGVRSEQKRINNHFPLPTSHFQLSEGGKPCDTDLMITFGARFRRGRCRRDRQEKHKANRGALDKRHHRSAAACCPLFPPGSLLVGNALHKRLTVYETPFCKFRQAGTYECESKLSCLRACLPCLRVCTGRRVRHRQAERTGRRIPKTEVRNGNYLRQTIVQPAQCFCQTAFIVVWNFRSGGFPGKRV